MLKYLLALTQRLYQSYFPAPCVHSSGDRGAMEALQGDPAVPLQLLVGLVRSQCREWSGEVYSVNLMVVKKSQVMAYENMAAAAVCHTTFLTKSHTLKTTDSKKEFSDVWKIFDTVIVIVLNCYI